MTDQQQAIDAVERDGRALGRLDTVVNNAGVMLLGPIVDAPVEEWDRMVALNVQGLLYCAHAALPHLLAAAEDGPRRVADLVNISSVAGRVARLGSGVYNLTKHGVGAFSESLRQEVTGRHVRVSLVEPGAVSTELATHIRARDPRAVDQALRRHRAAGGRRHRRRHRLHRHPPPPRGDQRAPGPPHRTGGLTPRHQDFPREIGRSSDQSRGETRSVPGQVRV